MFLFFLWQFTFPSTWFLAGSKLQLPFPLSGRSITFTGTCRGERYPAILHFLLSAPPCVYFCSRCVWLCAPLARFVFHALGAGAVLTRSCVLTAAAAAAESLGVPGCVLLDKAIRASLHGLLLGAEDPAKCLTVVQKGHLPTNICSHCESLARLHTLEEGRHAGVHTQTCRKETPHRG